MFSTLNFIFVFLCIRLKFVTFSAELKTDFFPSKFVSPDKRSRSTKLKGVSNEKRLVDFCVIISNVSCGFICVCETNVFQI